MTGLYGHVPGFCFGCCPHQGKLGQFFIFSRLCESIWSTCVLRTFRRHLTISLWAYCRGSCSGVWSGWLAHCYRPFSPCTTISRAVNRTCLIYWMCFAFYQGRPNHASLAIRHNTWFLSQITFYRFTTVFVNCQYLGLLTCSWWDSSKFLSRKSELKRHFRRIFRLGLLKFQLLS